MGISSQHFTGFAIGLGVAALGFVIFRKFQGKGGKSALGQRTDQPLTAARDEAAASLEELMLEKERLEELIAERELAEQEDPNRLKVQSTSDVGL